MKRQQTLLALTLGVSLIGLPQLGWSVTKPVNKTTAPVAPTTLDEFEETAGVVPSPKPATRATRTPAIKKGARAETGVTSQFPDWSKRRTPDYKPADQGLDNEY